MPPAASWKDALDPVNRMDVEREERQHELALADDKKDEVRIAQQEQTRRARSEQRKEMFGFAAGAAVLIALIAAIYLYVSGPEAPDQTQQIERDREVACVDDGGGWVPGELLTNATKGICVYPGKTVGE